MKTKNWAAHARTQIKNIHAYATDLTSLLVKGETKLWEMDFFKADLTPQQELEFWRHVRTQSRYLQDTARELAEVSRMGLTLAEVHLSEIDHTD